MPTAAFRLQKRVKSQLLVDLLADENLGRKFYLIANRKPDLYGQPHSTLRDSVNSYKGYVLRLKRKNEGHFLDLHQKALRYLEEISLISLSEQEDSDDSSHSSPIPSYLLSNSTMNSPSGSTGSTRSRPAIRPSPARLPFSPTAAHLPDCGKFTGKHRIIVDFSCAQLTMSVDFGFR